MQRVHIGIPVSDLAASVAFYRQLFDSPPSKERGDYANFRLEAPPIHLAINLSPDKARSGADRHHFGVELPDAAALAAWTARLRDAGLPLVEQRDEECCYATADKTWATDPDGHRWELWVRTGEAARRESAKGCCAPAPTPAGGCC